MQYLTSYWKELLFGIAPSWLLIGLSFALPEITKNANYGLMVYGLVYTIPFAYLTGLFIKFGLKCSYNFLLVTIVTLIPVLILLIYAMVSILFLRKFL